ncbi:hypothetical protein Y032_0084g1720 [Ancylostoma ceylanicum]|uniref:Uncharacterized protein n=1 Tax=Ancylostoma ceylanicum TaxID=53326 RepID=A0A016TPS0_9BILA|nr:hypothetical protein Y032_0084g1720 [Ancylostoma ceylanicum]
MRRDGEQKKIHQGNVVELRQHNKTIDMDYFKWDSHNNYRKKTLELFDRPHHNTSRPAVEANALAKQIDCTCSWLERNKLNDSPGTPTTTLPSVLHIKVLCNSDWRTRAAVTPICLDSNGVDPIIHDLFGLRVQRVGVTGSPNAPIRVA